MHRNSKHISESLHILLTYGIMGLKGQKRECFMAKEVFVQGISVKYKQIEKEDYISLTDIACMRNAKEPKDVVKSWMRNHSTLEYLALWENFYNPNFKGDEIDPLLALTGRNDFTMSPSRWIEEFHAIGIVTKQGKGGGTFAHQDIAFKFASWISAEFEFYLIVCRRSGFAQC